MQDELEVDLGLNSSHTGVTVSQIVALSGHVVTRELKRPEIDAHGVMLAAHKEHISLITWVPTFDHREVASRAVLSVRETSHGSRRDTCQARATK